MHRIKCRISVLISIALPMLKQTVNKGKPSHCSAQIFMSETTNNQYLKQVLSKAEHLKFVESQYYYYYY